MKIRTKFILPIAALFIVAALITVFSINTTLGRLVGNQIDDFNHYAADVLSKQATARKQSIYDSIEQSAQIALQQAALFTELAEVQQVYQLALSGQIENEADPTVQHARQQLRHVMNPYIRGFKRQSGQEALNLHFHLPNNRSLARLWRDGWQVKRDGKTLDVADDLSTFRQTVVEVNQGQHKPLTGIEVGRGGFALRGIAPVSGPNGEHFGSCEVLASFDDILKINHIDHSYQIAVYMLAELLPIATSLQNAQQHPLLDGKYVLASSTDSAITMPVIRSTLLDSGRNTEHQQVVGSHFVSTFPIKDYSGRVAGVMALVYDMAAINALTAQTQAVADQTLNEINWRFGGGGVLLVVVAIGVVFLVARILTTPLTLAAQSTKKIALGDLNQNIAYQSSDEVGELATAINTMITSLKAKAEEAMQIADGNLQIRVAVCSEHDSMGQAFQTMVSTLNEVLGEVHQAATQIDSGSQQVSDTAQHLSQGATESAASLEEISSSMNEIGAQTQQTASNSKQASQLANDAQRAAQAGSAQMDSMISAMSEINAAGQNIHKIIKVIDEIAFQTNLLALNAAVEAARAGQHGKGFAVVAEEVRNLAARSAKAAEETTQMIEGSVEKAENGTQIAKKTAAALTEIVSAITEASGLVERIAIASNEQAQGISQINIGLGQIDQVVQQSTATAEESAAAAEQLSSQSAQLRHMLSRFSLTLPS